MKIHLDTDIGGDLDDLCALAMLLKWPDLEITGITTVTDDQGKRAGYVQHVLNLAGRSDIPVCAGADVADAYYRFSPGYPDEVQNWKQAIPPKAGSSDEALDLIKDSLSTGAVLVGIGQYTNFALLDKKYPNSLKDAKLFLMGGYIYPNPPDFPQWENQDDYNIQLDVASARYVLENSSPTLIPLAVSCQTALRREYLPALRHSGVVGELVAYQAELFALHDGYEEKYGATCAGLPDDLINFQHDPLACAIALGWREGVEIETVALKFEARDTWLYETPDPQGIPTRLVTKINASAFNEFWLDMICR